MTEIEMLSYSFTLVLQVSAATVDSVLGVEQCQGMMAVTVRFNVDDKRNGVCRVAGRIRGGRT